MATVRVVAPFVTLAVKDVAGATVVTGFYEGMLAEGVEGESLDRHLRKGMVEEVASEVPAAGPKSSDKDHSAAKSRHT